VSLKGFKILVVGHGKVGLWVAHKPAECKLKDGKQDGGKGGEKKKEDKQGGGKPSLKPSTKLTAAMTAIKKVSWVDACTSSDEDVGFLEWGEQEATP